MFNLLPEDYKKSLRNEYAMRRATVAIGLLAGLGMAGVILVIPFFILAQMEIKSLTAQIGTLEEQVDIDSGSVVNKDVKRVETQLRKFMNMDEREDVDVILEQIITESGEGIQITNFSVRFSEEGVFEASLAGNASDRLALRSFGERLEATDMFDRVNIPVSNFAQNTDIPFSITVYSHEE